MKQDMDNKIKSVYSEKNDVKAAVSEIQKQLQGFDTKLVLYFTTSHHDPQHVAREMNAAFVGVENFGCTTAGEVTSGKMLENSIVAMAFSDEAVDDTKIALIENLATGEQVIVDALNRLGAHFKQPLSSLNYKEYVGLLMIDGMSGQEEHVIEKIGDHTNIMIVGGSAGDDLKFKQTFVFHNGVAATDAAVLCIMKPKIDFDVIKTQSFQPSDKTLRVTKTNEQRREVLEFDGQPAANIYAEALETTVDNLPKKAFRNPLGFMVSETEPFVRSPRVVENNSVLFYCSVKEGMELNILSPTDIIEDTKRAIEDKRNQMGSISAIINFHCILRTLDLKEQGKTQSYGELFTSIPTVGFSTYGECYLSHINQTSTMLVFK